MIDTATLIQRFMERGPYAVVGASRARHKYGNKVLRAYQQRGLEVYPVNPGEVEIEGQTAYPSLNDLPVQPRGISIITPPEVTERIVEEAADVGAEFVWMQPGAESQKAIATAQRLGLEVIADGSCFLVVSGYREA
jgi:predicted CoA-binding protein